MNTFLFRQYKVHCKSIYLSSYFYSYYLYFNYYPYYSLFLFLSLLFNMKAYFTLAIPFVSALASASPVTFKIPYITVSVINDITGHSAQATVPADGTVFSIPELFQNSIIDVNGQILASSAQLIQFSKEASCSFNKGATVVPLNSQNTFATLNAEDVAVPAELNYVTFQCQV